MANVIGRLTNNEVEVLQVDAIPGSGAGTTAPIGAIAAYNNGTTGSLYLKTGALDTAWDQINSSAVSGTVLSGTAGRQVVYGATGNVVGDNYVQNGFAMVVTHVTQPSRAVAITYSIPNPGNSVASADFVLTEGNQQINGNKTFGGNMIIQGNLDVQGSMTTIESTITTIADPTITLNKGGTGTTSANSGIEIEENAAIVAYMEVAAARNGWQFKAPTNANQATILLSSLSANRSYTLPDISGTFALGAGANGNVAFWTGASSLSANANFFWDNTNGRLGIGNGAPSVELHVTGNARITGLSSAAPVRSSALGVLSNGAIVLTATSDVSGILPIANGGTNSGVTLNNNRIMVSSGGAIVEAAALTNGQLLIGSTGAAPVAANITVGALASLTVSNGAGSIVIDAIQDIRTTASPTFANATLSGKTAGSIIFAGASGVLSQNNANLFWDNTNARLGLGTATPARLLDVNGSSVFRSSIRQSDSVATNANWEQFQAQVATTDATTTTVTSITVPTDSAVLVIANIVGRRTAGSAGANGDSAVYIRTARFKNVGGTVTIQNLQTDYTSEDQLGWNGTLDVSGTSARIRVTGAANNNVTWTATYQVITLS
jgi:hypothetical protein